MHLDAAKVIALLIMLEETAQRQCPEILVRPYNEVRLPPTPKEMAPGVIAPRSAVFRATSCRGVEMLLDSNLEAVAVAEDHHDGRLPLLQYCLHSGIASRSIVRHLRHQVGEQWKGVSAIDLGR